MNKFHVTASGDVRPCNATKRACRYGESEHFNSHSEALRVVEERLSIELNTIHSSSKKPKKLSTRFDDRDAFRVEDLRSEIKAYRNSESLRSSLQGPPTFYPTASSEEIIKSLKRLNSDGDPYFDERSLNLDDREDSITLRFNDFNETPTIAHINKKNGSIAIFDDASNIDEDEQLVLRYASKNLTSSDFSKADKITENLADLLDEADEVKSWEKDDKAVASSYLSFEHYRINEALRNETASNDLNQTISRLEVKDTLEEDTVVYRGLRKLPENMLKELNKGSYSDSGLLSTSTNPKVALGFSGNRKDSVILKIVLPKGTKCWDISKDDSEAEIILPRNFDLSSAKVLQLDENVEVAK